jgi:hypothetical protein
MTGALDDSIMGPSLRRSGIPSHDGCMEGLDSASSGLRLFPQHDIALSVNKAAM